MLNVLLLLVPVAVALEFLAPERHILVFVASGLAIVPLAGWMGRATEELAVHTGEGIGGLLNATFGNAAELIIAVIALNRGLYEVVKASIAGSIIANVLLVLGAAMVVGGFRFKEQTFDVTAANSQATMLTLATVALMGLAAFRHLGASPDAAGIADESLIIAGLLMLAYALNLVFQLVTHKHHFAGGGHGGHAKGAGGGWSVGRAAAVLAGATVLIAWMSEILVGAIEPTASDLGMNNVFVGVFVVAILGNAAEHATAVVVAGKNKMDLALSIAIGSSVQIALFVAPLLVILSQFVGPQRLDLLFDPTLVVGVFFAVLVTSQVAADGRSDWLEGMQLLVVYMILGVLFFFVPESAVLGHG